MNYEILKLNDIIIVIAEYDKKRFEIEFQNGKFSLIRVYECLSFNHLINLYKRIGFKQIKNFRVRQDNEENI